MIMSAVEDAALDAYLAPRVRPRTRLVLEASGAPLAPTASRFGGVPYLEVGEEWPECVCDRPMSFICQLDVRGTEVGERLPFALCAFYFCWECFPQDPEPGPWTLRTYADPRDDQAIAVDLPEGIDVTTPCAVELEDARSLPVWEGQARDAPEALELARAADPESPWTAYHAACERVAGPQDIESAIGGYPHWLQGDDQPDGGVLVATIDSEADARISWGDCGAVYLFLTPDGPRMVLQSL